ncbi:MAG: hypothetical protein D6788_00825 [Planctomycetota bacterium]|nr:MAG: hypothetical protein D6788_00825 [Planctomycetota bacterium]
MNKEPPVLVRMPMAGLLSWLVPGLGHLYLGQRARGIVLMVTVTVTFWTGVAIGGVRSTIDPRERQLWFIAQMGTAGNTLAGYGLHLLVDDRDGKADGTRARAERDPHTASRPATSSPAYAHWISSEVGVHYTGVAGLLNLLVIFDALGRAERSGPRQEKKKAPPGGGP